MVWGWFIIGFTRLLRHTPHHLPSWSYNSNHLFASSPTSLLAFRCAPFFHPKKHREAEISQASRGWQGWRPTWSSNSKLPVHLPAWEDLQDDRSRLTDNWNRPWDTHKKKNQVTIRLGVWLSRQRSFFSSFRMISAVESHLFFVMNNS